MGNFSFRDAQTHVLVAWGFVADNRPSDVRQPEADDFALAPGQWQWDGAAWVPYVPPAPPRSPLEVARAAVLADPTVSASLKAFVAEL